MTRTIILSLIIFVMMAAAGNATPCGAVLYREKSPQHLPFFNVPDTAYHHYFGFLEGPAWENKYSAFRFYADSANRNALDIIGKYQPIAILQNFDDPAVDEHVSWPWGTDIFKVSKSMGFGAFRLFNNDQWLNPQIGKSKNIDSLVIAIADSSTQTPKVIITFYGWNIGSGNKITVIWTITTLLNERPTQCEVAIQGSYTGKVIVGMIKNAGVGLIQDPNKALLATLGKQGGLNEGATDTLLLAIFAEKKYFSSFSDNTLNYGMALTPDAEKRVKWSIAYSWAKEAAPVFRNPDWQNELFGATSIKTGGPAFQSGVKKPSGLMAVSGQYEIFSISGRKISPDKKRNVFPCGVFIERLPDGSLRKITNSKTISRDFR